MKTSFGTAYTTDTVTQLGSVQNGKAQIKYNVTGGWKIGWIYSNNINDGSTPVVNNTLTRGLYNNSSLSSKITCGFDGYQSTPGRHEGIDFALGYGKNVYSLIDGEVINVIQGSNSGSLSTISIYDAASNKSVIYLHSAPKVSVGQKVKKGDLIATESNRGATTHTHVEVRNGRQTHAAKSVNDPVLDNQNPTAYWNSKGYKVE
jgi:murein DD-endopeptidase MepM/ murein hydrolase activator NlpD